MHIIDVTTFDGIMSGLTPLMHCFPRAGKPRFLKKGFRFLDCFKFLGFNQWVWTMHTPIRATNTIIRMKGKLLQRL